MPITFAADFDYKSLRHVSVRSRRNSEMDLPPMPTAEEAAAWANRELKFCSRTTGWAPNYDDGVTERRDAEKARRDEAARKRLSTNHETFLEEISAVKVRPSRLVSSTQKIVADVVGVPAQELNWSANLHTLPASELLSIAKRCNDTFDPAFAWNLNVRLREPRVPHAMIPGNGVVWSDPTRPSGHNMRTLGLQSKSSRKAEIEEWMKMAEENRLPGRSTRCALTGRSLVIKTSYFGRRSWYVAPTFDGMSVEAAQQVASAAAIQAGLVRGVVRGTPPALVSHLRNNAQDWLSLVIATRHPIFYTVAAQLVKMGGESLAFSDDTEHNRAEWQRLLTKISVTDAASVPNHR